MEFVNVRARRNMSLAIFVAGMADVVLIAHSNIVGDTTPWVALGICGAVALCAGVVATLQHLRLIEEEERNGIR